jgi:hypothetical protein
MENKLRFPFISYYKFIFLLIIPLVKSFSFLKEYDKKQITFIPSFKDDSKRIKIQTEKKDIVIKQIKMECFTKSAFPEEYNPFIFKENDYFYFEINLNKFSICRLNSIISNKGNINYLNNENPIFNFQEILKIQNNVKYKDNNIISSFQLIDYHIKLSNSNQKLELVKELNGEFIYNFNSEFQSNITLCKNQICFEIEKK